MTQVNAIGRSSIGRSGVSRAPALRAVSPAPSAPASRSPSVAPVAAAPALAPVSAADPAARVRALFEEQLPRLIARRADLFDAVRGTLTVFVEGAGAWSIQFGDHTRADAITPATGFEGDGIAAFSVAGFVALLDGAPSAQAPVVMGDARLLSRLGQLMLEPARGPLGARLSHR